MRVDVLVAGEPVDALSLSSTATSRTTAAGCLSRKLREEIPRQMFDVPIQAAIGARIIARETVKAKRKDVLAKCYGGDISRKRKLLEKQKKGKKRMKQVGAVEVPQEAFLAVLNIGRARCGRLVGLGSPGLGSRTFATCAGRFARRWDRSRLCRVLRRVPAPRRARTGDLPATPPRSHLTSVGAV